MGSGSVREGLLTPSLRACLRGPYADFCLQSENLGFPGGVSFKHLFHSERAMPFSHHMSQHDMRWANPRDKQIGFFFPSDLHTPGNQNGLSCSHVFKLQSGAFHLPQVDIFTRAMFPKPALSLQLFPFWVLQEGCFCFSMLHSKKLAHLVVLVYQREPM